MNKMQRREFYTNELRNNRRSYAKKTNREIIKKTTYKRDAKNVWKQRSFVKKECGRNNW